MTLFNIRNYRLGACLVTGILTTLLAGLVGCGAGVVASPEDVVVSASLDGIVHGGQFPIGGSNIALYLTSGSGYSSSLANVGMTTTSTDGNGTFSLSVSGITCPANSYAYIVSAGGDPSQTYTGADNSGIYLVDALGPCSGLGSIRHITLNELTTVAAAYGLSGFAPAGGAGMTEANAKLATAVPVISTSSTNAQGLADAVLNAQSIVSSQYGQIYTTTPNGAGTVPTAVINELGNILSGCVNQLAVSNSGCSNLFTYATPPTTSPTAPVNIWQAILDIAQYPDTANVTNLHNISGVKVAFGLNMTTAPNDWTVGITYSNNNVSSAQGMVIDDFDDVYVMGSSVNDLLEFSPQGALLGADGGSLSATTDSFRYGAFDKLANLWLADGLETGVYKYVPSSQAFTLYSYAALDSNNNNYSIAVDQDNDVWTQSYKKNSCSATSTSSSYCATVEFVAGTTTPYTPYATFPNTGATATYADTSSHGGARDIVYDVLTGNVWTTDYYENFLNYFPTTARTTAVATATANNSTSPTTVGSKAGSPATNNYGTTGLAIDAASNAWAVVQGGPSNSVTGSTTSAIAAGLYELTKADALASTQPGSNVNLLSPAYDIIDGNGNVFVTNNVYNSADYTTLTTSSVVEYSPSSAKYVTVTTNLGFSPGATYTASSTPTTLPGTLAGGTVYQASNISIDRSGALWLLSTGSGTSPSLANLVQVLGVAAPTRPVLAYGGYGAKP